MSFATVCALAALLLSAAGLIGDAPPAAAHSRTLAAAPQQSSVAAPASASPTMRTDASTPATASPGVAAPTDTPPPSSTPSPPPTPEPLVLDPLPGGVVTRFPLTVSGTGAPGDSVAVSAGSTPGPAESCTAPIGGDGHWSCALGSLPDGPGVAVRAEATSGGSASGRVMVLHPPVIAGDGAVPSTGGVRGSAYPGAQVTVTADTGASCTFPADSSGNWGCVLGGALSDGRHTVTATQVADFSSQRSAPSTPVTLQVDRTAPPAPSIVAPAGGSAAAGAPLTFDGAGETGAHVTLYASTAQGTTVVCAADVSGGAWSCHGTLPAGTYAISALQRDAAGNVSAGSNTISLTVDGAAGTPAPSATRAPATTPAPVPPTPAAPAPAPPSGPTHPDTKGWLDAPFTTASAPVVTAASLPEWMRSVGLAIAALLLLVLPARLLTAALARARAEHGRTSRSSVFGRNRPRRDLADASPLFGTATAARTGPQATVSGARPATASEARTSAAAVAAVGVAAVLLTTLSTPVPDASAYPRVALAVALAIAAVNAVWVLSGRALARHLQLPPPRLVLRPGMLIVVGVAAIGSRLLELSPALLFALVLGLALGPHAGRIRRGRIAAVQVSALAALGVVAWLAVGLLSAPSGPVLVFLAEFVNVLAVVGIGSASVMLLPVGGLAGRAVLQWSRWLWLALSLVVYTVLFALLLPIASLVERGVGVVVIVGVAVGFAAASVAVWLWERYVAPALDRTAP